MCCGESASASWLHLPVRHAPRVTSFAAFAASLSWHIINVCTTRQVPPTIETVISAPDAKAEAVAAGAPANETSGASGNAQPPPPEVFFCCLRTCFRTCVICDV